MQQRIGAHTHTLFPGWIDRVRFDCTTLSKSICEETLRKYGYGKKGKQSEIRVWLVLALAVTRGGLSLGHEVFPCDSVRLREPGTVSSRCYARCTPIEVPAMVVADAGMFSKDNQHGLEVQDCRAVVIALPHDLPQVLTDPVGTRSVVPFRVIATGSHRNRKVNCGFRIA